MIQSKKWVGITMLAGIAAFTLGLAATRAQAPAAKEKKEMGQVVITLYRAAPGKQVDLLKWLADRDAVNREAGLPPSQLYAHTYGDGWDFAGISVQLTKEQDAKVDELLKKKGLKTGFAGALEFRTMIASHSDTYAMGPTSAADLLMLAGPAAH